MPDSFTTIRDVGTEATGWVRGTVIGEAPLQAPLSGRHCTYYKIVVEARDDHGWKRIAYESRGQSFELDDGTGIAIVDPEGSQVEVDYDRQYEVVPNVRLQQVVAELMRRLALPEATPLIIREGVLAPGEVVAVHGRLVREADPDPARKETRLRVCGPGRERPFVSERSVDQW